MQPKFSNRNIGNSPLHLGTREIQLVCLKNALLLGVSFSYGTELVGVQPPAAGASGEVNRSWRAWARSASAQAKQAATASGALDFKPNKTADYTTGVGQGKCNQIQTSDLDAAFARGVSDGPPPGATEEVAFDALLLAEGEWSPTCKLLGVTKSIDRFTQAIGLVINLALDPAEPRTKDPNMRSFTISPLDEVGQTLKKGGIAFEFGEFLKGETHYIVLTIKKASLLSHGVLRENLSGAALLTRSNVDEDALMTLSRKIATLVGLPETTQFCDFHPAKLFDFSTRARCLAPFRVLSTVSGGAASGEVRGLDLEAQSFLRASETAWYERALSDAEAEVEKRHEERRELDAAIAQLGELIAERMAQVRGAASTGKEGGGVGGAAAGGADPDVSAQEMEELKALSAKQLRKFIRQRGVEEEEALTNDQRDELLALAVRCVRLPLVLWQKVLTPDGKAYWYNTETKATTWTRPDQPLPQLPPPPKAATATTATAASPAGDAASLAAQNEQLRAANLTKQQQQRGTATEDGQRDLSPAEELEMYQAQLEAYTRGLAELEEKMRINTAARDACRTKQLEWLERVASTEGSVENLVPIFPIGDALLEPFWPQGLGSNRGFHSALDAVWAIHILHTSSLDDALLERNFWYDLMLQGPWTPALLKPSKAWSADPVTRYADGAIVRTRSNYTNASSKRLFRGPGATPARIEALGLKAERGAGGANTWR